MFCIWRNVPPDSFPGCSTGGVTIRPRAGSRRSPSARR